MFRVNFDILGGMTFDEWLAEEDNSGGRHATIDKKEIEAYEMSRNEKNTVSQTKWAINCFTNWCEEMGKTVDLKTITREDMNEILRDFYGTVRNGKGDHYGISSYVCLRSGLNRFINDPPLSRCWCLMKDSAFTSANNVFVGVVKTRRRQGHDKTKHHGSIPACELATIKASLDPTTPEGLVRKVWFDIQLHFGRRGKEGNRQLTTGSFAVFADENGQKYASMTFNEETKNHKDPQERKKDSRRGYMYSLPGNPRCPVASLEKYLSLLPPNAPAFYLHPKKSAAASDDIWYRMEPMGVHYLATMLPRICKAAGTQIYTNHCLRSTLVQTLSNAGLEAREIMSVSGHKSESSLQSYWAPNLNERQRWSNILAGEGTSNTEPPAKRARVVGSDIIRDDGDMRNVFHGCTINGDIQININKR